MPLILQKSGVHRAACMLHRLHIYSYGLTGISLGFALCRELLRQVQQLPLAQEYHKVIGTQIWSVIKRNKKLQSRHETSTALRLGYEVGLRDLVPEHPLLSHYHRHLTCYGARQDGKTSLCVF